MTETTLPNNVVRATADMFKSFTSFHVSYPIKSFRKITSHDKRQSLITYALSLKRDYLIPSEKLTRAMSV